jgi:pyridoxine kinase
LAQKRIAAINDISGFGKCSLTVALPILSALGCSTSVVPTAVLSTHTGEEFSGYTYRDLTPDLNDFLAHWLRLGLSFDAIYSGYLGSFAQIDMVSGMFESFKSANTIIMVDPVMGDNGKLYSLYTPQMASELSSMCKKADIITPNITEAAFLTGMPYKEAPHSREYIIELMKRLFEFGCKHVVITGVCLSEDEIGVACGSLGSSIAFFMEGRYKAFYSGTGDIFASALLGLMLKGLNLECAAELAAKYITRCIERTWSSGVPHFYGINFEEELPWLFSQMSSV